MPLEQRRQKLGHKRLPQNFAQTHGREQRNQFRNKGRILARFDHQGKLHGGLRHFDRGLGAFVKSAIHNVSPADQFGNRRRVKAEAGLRDVGDKAGAGGVIGVVEMARIAALLLKKKMLLIRRGKKGAQMVIEPPGYARRSAVLEVDDRVLVAGKIRLLKERSGAMHQPVKIVVRIRADAFAVKAHEERSRARSVKAPVVIENANLQTVMFLSRKRTKRSPRISCTLR